MCLWKRSTSNPPFPIHRLETLGWNRRFSSSSLMFLVQLVFSPLAKRQPSVSNICVRTDLFRVTLGAILAGWAKQSRGWCSYLVSGSTFHLSFFRLPPPGQGHPVLLLTPAHVAYLAPFLRIVCVFWRSWSSASNRCFFMRWFWGRLGPLGLLFGVFSLVFGGGLAENRCFFAECSGRKLYFLQG